MIINKHVGPLGRFSHNKHLIPQIYQISSMFMLVSVRDVSPPQANPLYIFEYTLPVHLIDFFFFN